MHLFGNARRRHVEVLVFELNEIIDHAGWQKAWLQYCRLQGAPKEIVAKDMATGMKAATRRTRVAGVWPPTPSYAQRTRPLRGGRGPRCRGAAKPRGVPAQVQCFRPEG